MEATENKDKQLKPLHLLCATLKANLLAFQEAFFPHENDAKKIRSMIESKDQKNYIHFIFFQSLFYFPSQDVDAPGYKQNCILANAKIHPSFMKIFAVTSWHYSEKGCNIDWVFVNPFHPKNLSV